MTEYHTSQLYLKSLEGVQDASQITVITYAGEGLSGVNTNMHGTVSFTNATMKVQLEQPNYPDGVHLQGYVPYDLNGTYQVVTDLSSNAIEEPTSK